jgi:glycosyltransferase involved in cell wall biosynthesis
MTSKIPCSVEILTFNNEDTLEKCLRSVKNFDEIIICDGGSNDDTLQIAERYGCKIIEQDKRFKNKDGSIENFAGIRNQGLKVSKHDWFLFVDSDEYLSSKVAKEIRVIVDSSPTAPVAYWMSRKYVISGETIECASTYPNRQMRFFHKSTAIGFIKKIHEKIQLKDGVNTPVLENIMFVPLEEDTAVLKEKWSRYIKLEVERREDITLGKFASALKEALKVSVLYNYRLLRNIFFCRGKKLPLTYEKEYQLYNFRLAGALFKKLSSR